MSVCGSVHTFKEESSTLAKVKLSCNVTHPHYNLMALLTAEKFMPSPRSPKPVSSPLSLSLTLHRLYAQLSKLKPVN